ncbi:hypothetical protein HA461_20420 [Rhizobium leguminosarum bv. trifolii]|uniref:hypothetical protein n=1 Tax=Rhizobium leguminosarum TaxID=384 RepID=UPI00140FDC5C|nr:hypothetical protein [Rhizobium leguminosarum]QIO49635.1 hypothetical protein HA461_20420 [Rhizobium leguminosarum bv. trifolii]
MSAFITLRLDDQVVILTDGAVYPGYHDFTIIGYANKVWTFPHLDMVVAWRGTSDLCGLLLYKKSHKWTSFDMLLRELVEHAEEECDRFGTLWPGRDGACELAVCGWSDDRETFETYSFNMDTNAAICKPPQLTEQLYMAPFPDLSCMEALGIAANGHINITAVDQLKLLMQAQRDTAHYMGHPGDDADRAERGHCVGAFIQQTTLSRGHITSTIVKRWPDELGERIDPANGRIEALGADRLPPGAGENDYGETAP